MELVIGLAGVVLTGVGALLAWLQWTRPRSAPDVSPEASTPVLPTPSPRQDGRERSVDKTHEAAPVRPPTADATGPARPQQRGVVPRQGSRERTAEGAHEAGATPLPFPDPEWQRLVYLLVRGGCTPFLGGGTTSRVLPPGIDLSRQWAHEYDYPFEDSTNLPAVMQYVADLLGDPVFVKERLSHQLLELGTPDFSSPAEPHALLARLPITVYITVNFDDFMTRALHHVGKEPVTVTSAWYRSPSDDLAGGLPPGYQPSSQEPLVFHVHGNVREPRSLVLTDDDHLRLQYNLSVDIARQDREVIPFPVVQALAERPLLFLGCSMRDWSFRTLFHGVVRRIETQSRRHVCTQLPVGDGHPDDRSRAGDYLARYFAWLNITTYWGSVDEFCRELLDHLGRADDRRRRGRP